MPINIEADLSKLRRKGCGGWALYRLPGEAIAHYVACSRPVVALCDFSAMDDRVGWVAWPFCSEPDCPPLLIEAERHEVFHPVVIREDVFGESCLQIEDDRESYDRGFALCLEALRSGCVDKVVFSRRRRVLRQNRSGQWDIMQLFAFACERQPQSYVAAWWTPQAGLWLVSTPEILLADDGGDGYRTMALAGTMPADGEPYSWTDKNIQEQRYVADYIRSRLFPLAERIATSPTRTVRAGAVVHLETDFNFVPQCGVSVGILVGRLHPTPAVCGLPTANALRTLRRAETFSRRYYAGFSGPIALGGATRLFVSLRCMELFDDATAQLYAGGGLLRDSRLDEEWEETCRKMTTMEDVLTMVADRSEASVCTSYSKKNVH